MKKKNARRSDGRISVQVYIGLVDGKRKYKTVYGATQKEADEKAALVRASLHKGLDVAADRDSFGLWAERWMKLHSAGVSSGAMTSYRSAVKRLEPIFPVSIAKVRPYDIQVIINELAEKHPVTGRPASKRTLETVRLAARMIFNLAIDNRVIEYNPAARITIPARATEDKREALTEEEQGWILHTPHRAQRAAMIMMLAGLRRGELIPLTWRDIDLDARTIRVDKSVEMIKGHTHGKEGGKTKSSTRTVDIPQLLADYLRGEKEKDFSGQVISFDGLVCSNAQGQIHNTSSWRRMWESYIKELNFRYGKFIEPPKSKMQPGGVPMVIRPITAHWLRHTFATILYLSGVDVLTAKEQLGHSDIKTTLQIYTHLDSVYKRRTMAKLDDYLSGNSVSENKSHG